MHKIQLLEDLVKLPNENEWVEFKENFHSNDEIGERLSALANGAALNNERFGYLIFGVEDTHHMIKGTTFKPSKKKVGNDPLEHWLNQRISPRIDFKIHEFKYKDVDIVMFEVPSATSQHEPIKFKNTDYIRVGNVTRKLNDFPDKERKLWTNSDTKPFEKQIAKKNVSPDEIIDLLSTQSYFELFKLPYPSNRDKVIEKLISEHFVEKTYSNKYSITNLGAILFAKDLNKFPTIYRKAVRVIVYSGKNKLKTIREQTGKRGYAFGFSGLINWITSQLPSNEEIEKAFRRNVTVYPEIAIRELVANVIIHQDFSITGTGPIIEIYSDRIEFTSPGLPLITVERFIDEFQSRNEDLASFMRRIKICEEKGSGIDKVIFNVELYQLPAPNFQIKEKQTKVILYSPLELNEMDSKDKIRACYQHSCLCYVSNEKMTNQSLRKRFNIDGKNSAIASRIIRDALKAGAIKDDDPTNNSRKYKKYVPFWA